MNELDKALKELDDQAKAMAQTEEDMVQMGININASALNGVVKLFSDGVDAIVKDNKDKKYFDETLGDKMKECLDAAVQAILNQKAPEVKFNPNINVDLKPVLSIAAEIQKQNEIMLLMMKRVEASEGNEEKRDALITLTLGVITSTNDFLKKGLKQIDYTEQLNEIASKMGNDSNKIEKFKIIRGDFDLMKEVVPIYLDNVTTKPNSNGS